MCCLRNSTVRCEIGQLCTINSAVSPANRILIMAVMAGDSGGSSEALIVASWLSADVDAMCGTDDVTLRYTTENS